MFVGINEAGGFSDKGFKLFLSGLGLVEFSLVLVSIRLGLSETESLFVSDIVDFSDQESISLS